MPEVRAKFNTLIAAMATRLTVPSAGGRLAIISKENHQGRAIAASSPHQAIKAAGAWLWFLPPYSPDLNPIEQALSKIKPWMRHAQKRSIDETWRHIGRLVDTIQRHPAIAQP